MLLGDKMKRKVKGQDLLFYTAVIIMVGIVLLILSGYIQSRIEGIYRGAGDAFGEGEQ